MDLDPQRAEKIARRYLHTTDRLTRLGWGISGDVFLSPDARTAVKVHRHAESFARELEVYRRLKRLRLTQAHGLTIPRLRGFNTRMKLIRMDFVGPPYLLDFAGVRFDPPDFPEDTMASWHAGIQEFFGPNASIAYAVYDELAQHGLYYMDFRPSNLNLEGLPGLLPYHPSAEDE